MKGLEPILKRFESPDEVREFERGRFEVVRIGGMVIGRATYEPGWKWSEHVGPLVGQTLCTVEHVGIVLKGASIAALQTGQTVELREGSLFYLPPTPHDGWVIGDQTYVSLHLMGAETYAEERHEPRSHAISPRRS